MEMGDFTKLAKDYAESRPGYNKNVLNSILGLINIPKNEINFVDVGAGTGIWTKMVVQTGVRNAWAVEPNDEMRKFGAMQSNNDEIKWIRGSAEATTLSDNSADWVTMASSFHWADFDRALAEFGRLLKPNGKFTALWNPRIIKNNPILVEIEDKLFEFKGSIKRVSSGNSEFTSTLADRLDASAIFKDTVYMEGRHYISMSPERYLSAWKSVNDLQSQLGEHNFSNFIEFVEKKIRNIDFIEAEYLTRSWTTTKC